MVFHPLLLRWDILDNISKIGDVVLNKFVSILLEKITDGWSIFFKTLEQSLKRFLLSDKYLSQF